MAEDQIDASVGLAFSLRLFAIYRQSGLLHATIRNIWKVKGTGKACLVLDKGRVVSCYLEDSKGQRYPQTEADLCALDEEKGPFEWRLQPTHSQVSNPVSSASPRQAPRPGKETLVPYRLVVKLDEQQLQSYMPWQRSMLLAVFSRINGQRSVEDISATMQFPSAKVEETLRVLVSLRAIGIQRNRL